MTQYPQAPVLARLALGGDDRRRRPLYWRGEAVPDGAGGLEVAAGRTVDLGTWFNAAPVGWWREILGLEGIRLIVQGAAGELSVYRAGPDSRRQRVRTVQVDGTSEIDLPAGNVTWYWLEFGAREVPGHLASVRWTAVPAPARAPDSRAPELTGAPGSRGQPASVSEPAGRVTAVVPTYGREQDALEQVRLLLAPEMSDVVARVVLVDQARNVRTAPGADRVIAGCGDRLLLVEQDNLGGSGGYARGMLESLAHPRDAVLLLDDDARIEPDGLRRMLSLAALAGIGGGPVILGTPLLSAENPIQVEALAEGVRRRDFRWGPSDRLTGAVDVSVTDPSGWSFADPRARTDYAGWWGILLPPGTVAEIGLPAPYFLKWDDAEYGLRARRAGYRVATVPGTGTWHPTWAAKGTISSWAAWPLHRNRLATAAAYRSGRGVLADSLMHQIKHVLSLQYETADLWDAAAAQFLSGPSWLTGDVRSTRNRAQAVLDGAPAVRPGAVTTAGGMLGDGTVGDVTAGDGTAVTGRRVGAGVGRDGPHAPTGSESAASTPPGRGGRFAMPVRAVRAVIGLVRPAAAVDVVGAAPGEFGWRTGLGRDAVVLRGTDRVLARDPARARAALLRTLRLHAQAVRRWGALRRAYARALPASATEERWRAAIAGPER